jgi:hypothetical protein
MTFTEKETQLLVYIDDELINENVNALYKSKQALLYTRTINADLEKNIKKIKYMFIGCHHNSEEYSKIYLTGVRKYGDAKIFREQITFTRGSCDGGYEEEIYLSSGT